MKLYSEENPNHPKPRCFLLWVLGEVESIKNKLVKEVGLHNSIHSRLLDELERSIHPRLDELEREIISFVSFMDDLVERKVKQ